MVASCLPWTESENATKSALTRNAWRSIASAEESLTAKEAISASRNRDQHLVDDSNVGASTLLQLTTPASRAVEPIETRSVASQRNDDKQGQCSNNRIHRGLTNADVGAPNGAGRRTRCEYEHSLDSIAPLEASSTRDHKPVANRTRADVEAPKPRRHGPSVKIQIGFGNSNPADRDGTLRSTISSKVEQAVARLLSRSSGDRKALIKDIRHEETTIRPYNVAVPISIDVKMCEDLPLATEMASSGSLPNGDNCKKVADSTRCRVAELSAGEHETDSEEEFGSPVIQGLAVATPSRVSTGQAEGFGDAMAHSSFHQSQALDSSPCATRTCQFRRSDKTSNASSRTRAGYVRHDGDNAIRDTSPERSSGSSCLLSQHSPDPFASLTDELHKPYSKVPPSLTTLLKIHTKTSKENVQGAGMGDILCLVAADSKQPAPAECSSTDFDREHKQVDNDTDDDICPQQARLGSKSLKPAKPSSILVHIQHKAAYCKSKFQSSATDEGPSCLARKISSDNTEASVEMAVTLEASRSKERRPVTTTNAERHDAAKNHRNRQSITIEVKFPAKAEVAHAGDALLKNISFNVDRIVAGLLRRRLNGQGTPGDTTATEKTVMPCDDEGEVSVGARVADVVRERKRSLSISPHPDGKSKVAEKETQTPGRQSSEFVAAMSTGKADIINAKEAMSTALVEWKASGELGSDEEKRTQVTHPREKKPLYEEIPQDIFKLKPFPWKAVTNPKTSRNSMDSLEVEVELRSQRLPSLSPSQKPVQTPSHGSGRSSAVMAPQRGKRSISPKHGKFRLPSMEEDEYLDQFLELFEMARQPVMLEAVRRASLRRTQSLTSSLQIDQQDDFCEDYLPPSTREPRYLQPQPRRSIADIAAPVTRRFISVSKDVKHKEREFTVFVKGAKATAMERGSDEWKGGSKEKNGTLPGSEEHSVSSNDEQTNAMTETKANAKRRRRLTEKTDKEGVVEYHGVAPVGYICLLLAFICFVLLSLILLHRIWSNLQARFPTVNVPTTATYAVPASVRPVLTSTADATELSTSPKRPGIYFCNTTYCNQEAAYLKTLVSPNADRCDDFYEYVCDGWSRQNPPSTLDPTSIVSRDTLLQDELARHLISIVQSDSSDVTFAAKLHSACMDHNSANIWSFRNMLSRWVIGGWPLSNGSKWDTSDVWRFAAELVRDLDLATLVVVSVGVNPDFPARTVLELDQPRFLLSRADHARTTMANRLTDAVEETVRALGGPDAPGFVEQLLNVSLLFASIRRSASDGRKNYRLAQVSTLDAGIRTFLNTTFSNIIEIPSDHAVLLKSPEYVRADLVSQLSAMSSQDVLNYMGFLVLVHVAPFLSENLPSLRSLFLKAVLGRIEPDLATTSLLCFYAVRKLLPSCFAKSALRHQGSTNTDVTTRQWILRLEAVFIESLSKFSWVEDLSALIVHYRLRRNPVTCYPDTSAFGSNECVFPETRNHLDRRRPLESFFNISVLNQQHKLQTVLKEAAVVKGHLTGFEWSTEPKYDPTRQKVGIPFTLFNNSVPTNSSSEFPFHLSRVAVRFYRAFVQMLFENIYEHEIPFVLSESSRQSLTGLMDCLKTDLAQLPTAVRVPTGIDEATLLPELLEQVAALKLSLEAFRQLQHVRRIWQLDFRYGHLPELSADELFFVYFALDNCESVSSGHVYNWDVGLPAWYRVNLALRHVSEFAGAFNCRPGSALAPHDTCHVFEQEPKRANARRKIRP